MPSGEMQVLLRGWRAALCEEFMGMGEGRGTEWECL